MRRIAIRILFLALIALVPIASSCAEDASTQVVVLMDTDYDVPSEVDRIRARVLKMSTNGVGETETWSNVFALSAEEDPPEGFHSLPASFAISPAEGDMDRRIAIELEALPKDGDAARVVSRAETGFIPGQSRLLRMWLFRACEAATCPQDTSCGCADAACSSLTCVDRTVDPQDLEPIDDPGVLPTDAAIPTGMVVAECEPPLSRCGTDCVDTTSNVTFCGSCTTACTSGQVCVDGGCVDPTDCRANQTGCTGSTYCDPTSGACLPGCDSDLQCAADETCNTEVHECVCAIGLERCPPSDEGACVDTQTDPAYCGDCNTICPTGWVCQAGNCVSTDCRINDIGCGGFTYCEPNTGTCLPGCDRDVQCLGPNERCNLLSHQCVCRVGLVRCFGECVDTRTDARYCGGCTPCAPGELCRDGQCLDPTDCRENGIGCEGFTYCDPITGTCLPGCDRNLQCPGANERCDKASHQCVCTGNSERCGDECVDTRTDPRHCGFCGRTCRFFCASGSCWGGGGDDDD